MTAWFLFAKFYLKKTTSNTSGAPSKRTVYKRIHRNLNKMNPMCKEDWAKIPPQHHQTDSCTENGSTEEQGLQFECFVK